MGRFGLKITNPYQTKKEEEEEKRSRGIKLIGSRGLGTATYSGMKPTFPFILCDRICFCGKRKMSNPDLRQAARGPSTHGGGECVQHGVNFMMGTAKVLSIN
ncbi:hypothetical protein RUM43_006212 [Polyplax serrata]|uniref:Uncharacterized protein n=1 Tax=Polyplax serrata TaxID=468196 RepID=A0AAN8S202_POLSC